MTSARIFDANLSRRRVLSSALAGTALSLGLVGCSNSNDADTTSAAPVDTDALTKAGPVNAEAFDPSLPYLHFGSSSGVPVVDLYEDFLCPHCKTFHDAQGVGVEKLMREGTITLRVHPRPMLDPRSTPPGYSGRAAAVAVASFMQDPALYFRVSDVLYANQPGTEGLEMAELLDLAASAGADPAAIEAQIEEGEIATWLQEVVEPEAKAKEIGTPTVYVDGTLWEGNPEQPNALADDLAS